MLWKQPAGTEIVKQPLPLWWVFVSVHEVRLGFAAVQKGQVHSGGEWLWGEGGVCSFIVEDWQIGAESAQRRIGLRLLYKGFEDILEFTVVGSELGAPGGYFGDAEQMRFPTLGLRVGPLCQHQIGRTLPKVSLEGALHWCRGGTLQWLAICEDVQNCYRALCQEDQGGGSGLAEKLSYTGVGFAGYWPVREHWGESTFSSVVFQAENKRRFFLGFTAEIF